MKKIIFAGLLSLSLSACSLIHHSPDADPEANNAPEEGANSNNAAAVERQNLEAEVAKLKARLEAMETKLDVMSSSVERNQMKQSQPQITAEASEPAEPQPTMAAPVTEQPVDKTELAAAAVSKPAAKTLPAETLNRSAPAEDNGPVEKEFKVAMSYFQNGRNLEAAAKFDSLAKQNPNHLLAAHALYWAGEANARGQQWSNAIENWEMVENKYPHSAYLAESLAGLSRAYEAEGNAAKAKQYRDSLTHAFPAAPVTMNLVTHTNHEVAAPDTTTKEQAPRELQNEPENKDDQDSTEQD